MMDIMLHYVCPFSLATGKKTCHFELSDGSGTATWNQNNVNEVTFIFKKKKKNITKVAFSGQIWFKKGDLLHNYLDLSKYKQARSTSDILQATTMAYLPMADEQPKDSSFDNLSRLTKAATKHQAMTIHLRAAACIKTFGHSDWPAIEWATEKGHVSSHRKVSREINMCKGRTEFKWWMNCNWIV